MMQSAAPSQAALTMAVAKSPQLIRDMAPWASLAGMLRGAFSDPHLAQLFGRYATYVGGAPQASPALLALIAEAEARGVWSVKGGMHRLAQTLEQLAKDRGAQFLYATRAQRIETRDGRAAGVATTAGRIAADVVLFNGDPRALQRGLLGEAAKAAVPASAVEPRSLSAWVHAFAATATGVDLAYHTVFFGHDPEAEFNCPRKGSPPARCHALCLCTGQGGRNAPRRSRAL